MLQRAAPHEFRVGCPGNVLAVANCVKKKKQNKETRSRGWGGVIFTYQVKARSLTAIMAKLHIVVDSAAAPFSASTSSRTPNALSHRPAMPQLRKARNDQTKKEKVKRCSRARQIRSSFHHQTNQILISRSSCQDPLFKIPNSRSDRSDPLPIIRQIRSSFRDSHVKIPKSRSRIRDQTDQILYPSSDISDLQLVIEQDRDPHLHGSTI